MTTGHVNPLCACSMRVISYLAVLLAAALGLIFGTVYALEILVALPAVIIFAIVMAVLIVAILIYRCCMGCRFRRC